MTLVASSAGCAAATFTNDLLPNQPIPCHLSDRPSAADPDAVATESVAMEEIAFWELIGAMGGETDTAGFDALTEKLAELSMDDLVAFEARLTLALYALDDPCRAEWYRVNEPGDVGFVSDDVFLYARCDTVAAGRAVWQDALTSRTLPWGTVDPSTGNGELLLYVAGEEVEDRQLDIDAFYDLVEQRILVSFETGSNPAGWQSPPDADASPG